MASVSVAICSKVIDNTILLFVDNNEVELLIITSKQTLKTKNKKCGKEEVSELMKNSTDDAVTYDELLKKLIHSESVKLNTNRNLEWPSLPVIPNRANKMIYEIFLTKKVFLKFEIEHY